MQADIATPKDLGELVKLVRVRNGYTQRELARALGTTQRYIYEVEKGLPKRVDGNFYALLKKLGITVIAEIADE
jgi:HTH-type transcriptional regulator/antitoxin HipB